MTAHEVAARLHARRSGAGWIARCPAHDDRQPSLSIRAGRDGRVLICCFAGCATDSVLAAAGLGWRDVCGDAGAGNRRRNAAELARLHRECEQREQREQAARSRRLATVCALHEWRAVENAAAAALQIAGPDNGVAWACAALAFATAQQADAAFVGECSDAWPEGAQ